MTVKNSEVYAVNKLNDRKSYVIQKSKPTWQLNHKSVFEVILDWENICFYSDRLHDFSVTIPRCDKDVYVNNFFPRTARPWNSQLIQCFPLTYDLSGLEV